MTGQDAFRAALLDPDRPAPAGLIDPAGRPAGKRFDVYRNNVAASLTEALETGFPVIRKLVGAAFFKAMAGVYLRRHPPASPLMMFYGAEMPGFLAAFPPAQRLPYLPDVARLELALRHAYHAADPAPFDAARLQAMAPDRLAARRFGLAPSVALIRSAHPVHGIWQANTSADAPKPVPRAETVLVSRPAFDPVLDLIGPADAAFVAALQDRLPLGEAADLATARATAGSTAFDLSSVLGLLLARAALTDCPEGHDDDTDYLSA